jgi:hypothetical protein
MSKSLYIFFSDENFFQKIKVSFFFYQPSLSDLCENFYNVEQQLNLNMQSQVAYLINPLRNFNKLLYIKKT